MYYICVKNGKRAAIFQYRRKLERLGLSYKKKENQYTGSGDKDFMKKIKRYCFWKGLRFEFIDKKYMRNTTYRKEWLKNNKPVLGMYLCTYCGRIVRAGNITVDHIIPVNKAKQYIRYQKKLQRHHATTVNHINNLCGSCYRCNIRKSDKGGYWIWKGFFYQQRILRVLRLLIRWMFFSLFFITLLMFWKVLLPKF